MSYAAGATVPKDPDAERFVSFNWSDFLDTSAIASSEFVISGPDNELTQDNDAIYSGPDSADTNQWTKVRLLGGTAGANYKLTNRITTNEIPSQTDDRSVTIRVKERCARRSTPA